LIGIKLVNIKFKDYVYNITATLLEHCNVVLTLLEQSVLYGNMMSLSTWQASFTYSFRRISRRYTCTLEISQTGYKTLPCWLLDDKGYCQSPSIAAQWQLREIVVRCQWLVTKEVTSNNVVMCASTWKYIDMKNHKERLVLPTKHCIISYLAFNL